MEYCFRNRNKRLKRVSGLILMSVFLTSCASSKLTQSGNVQSYSQLKPSNGLLTKTRQRIDRQILLSARTVAIVPTQFSQGVFRSGLTREQLGRVANALERRLCLRLSKRFRIVNRGEQAELNVAALITRLSATSVVSSTASKVVNAGGIAARIVTGIPVPTPRLPFGLGSLSVEGVASTQDGRQAAVLTWARGADVLTVNARVSKDGDAYALAKEFASDFAKQLVTASDPMKAGFPEVPTAQSLNEFFGGKPKQHACDRFGRRNGLGNAIGGVIGLPPSWTDKGASQQ